MTAIQEGVSTKASQGTNMPRKVHLRSQGAYPPAGVAPIVDQHVGLIFTGSILVDGNRYMNCTFERCVITYSGGVPPSFSGCQFKDSRLSFAGAAANTLAFLIAMDSPDSGLQRVVRETFRGFTGH